MADSAPSGNRTVSLSGRVRRKNGSPVQGAHVLAQLQDVPMEKLIHSGLSAAAVMEKETSLAHTRPDGTYTLYVGEDMAYNVLVVPDDLLKADDKDSRWVAAAAEGISGAKDTVSTSRI